MIKPPAFKVYLKRGVHFLFSINSGDPDQRSKALILNTLLLSTILLVVGVILVLSSNILIKHLVYLFPRLIIAMIVLALLIFLYWRFRRGNILLPTIALVGFYFIAATGIVTVWGIVNQTGLLMFTLAIILAGILLGARYSMYALFLVVVILFSLVFLSIIGILHPDISWVMTMPTTHDLVSAAVSYSILLANIAVISWLFNRSREQSLIRAQRSEKALRRQKELLEVKVEQRTRQLQAAHLVRIQELYRLAEVGHMGTALLHDMANYLTVLSLDIEDLGRAKQNRSDTLRRIQQSIRHLDNLTGQVRQQIKGEAVISRFNIADEIDHVMDMLAYKAAAARVELVWQVEPRRQQLLYKGSVNHFWQIATNIIANGIDAYKGRTSSQRKVVVAVERTADNVVIRITDFGIGVAPSMQAKIFEPFYSTKKDGTGMGLSIVRSMVQKDFGGTIDITSSRKTGTVFTVTLPRRDANRKS